MEKVVNWLKQTGGLPDAEIELFIFLHETIHFKKFTNNLLQVRFSVV